VKLYVRSNRYEFMLCKDKRVKGEVVSEILGHYASLEGLVSGVKKQLMLSKAKKGLTVEELVGAFESFKDVKVEVR